MPQTFKLSDAILFDEMQQAWRVHADASRYASPIPGMMAHDELVFLRWAAERLTKPEDAIIDMGPLAGSSTLALATGLRRIGDRNQKIIHTYDLWRYDTSFESFFPGQSLGLGDNTFPLFWKNVEEVQNNVEPHRGDIREMNWNGSPIGILFLDAAKTPNVMAHVVREFLPSLREHGIFVQQDYVSSQHPWIHVAQELLMDNFEVADSPFGGTVNFLCTATVSGGLLRDDYFSSMEPKEVCRLIRRAASRLVGWEKNCVELSESYYWLMHGAFTEAGSILDRVCLEPSYNENARRDGQLIQSYLSTKSRPYPEYLLRSN